MANSLLDGLRFLINTIFNLYLFLLIIRFILSWSGIHYFHPLTQLVLKLTRFLVQPVKKFIQNRHGIEVATLILIVVIDMLKWLLETWLSFGMPHWAGLCLLVIVDSIQLFLQTFFYVILLQAVVSWIQPHSALIQILYQFTAPIMRPFRRLIPPINGFDISPIPVLILIQLIMIILIQPFIRLGWNIAYG